MSTSLPRLNRLPIERRLRFLSPGPTGDLEVLFEPVGPEKGPVAVVAHPHPAGGGTLDNKVVHTCARALRTAGFHTLRFNFRGVGASGGRIDGAGAERADVRAMLELARTGAKPDDTLLFAGYSYGSWVGLPLAEADMRMARLVAIGLPLGMRDFPFDAAGTKPLLVVQGTRDAFGPREEVLAWADRRARPPRVIWIETDHFFHGKLRELEKAVVGFACSKTD